MEPSEPSLPCWAREGQAQARGCSKEERSARRTGAARPPQGSVWAVLADRMRKRRRKQCAHVEPLMSSGPSCGIRRQAWLGMVRRAMTRNARGQGGDLICGQGHRSSRRPTLNQRCGKRRDPKKR